MMSLLYAWLFNHAPSFIFGDMKDFYPIEGFMPCDHSHSFVPLHLLLRAFDFVHLPGQCPTQCTDS